MPQKTLLRFAFLASLTSCRPTNHAYPALTAPSQPPATANTPCYCAHPTHTKHPMNSQDTQETAPVFSSQAWRPEIIDTAANALYLSPAERQVIAQINKARTDPAAYARAYLEPLRTLYQGKHLRYPGEIPILTQEGAAALEECIHALKAMQPLAPLWPKPGLAQAARDQVMDQGKTGYSGHAGSDGSTSGSRVARYGRWGVSLGENIGYGHAQANRIVAALLIDDGVPSRGHRSNFFEPQFRFIGVAVGPHPHFGHLCVMDFAGAYD